jgi:hypothetical protein
MEKPHVDIAGKKKVLIIFVEIDVIKVAICLYVKYAG